MRGLSRGAQPARLSTLQRQPGDREGHGPHELTDPDEALKTALGAAWKGGATFAGGSEHLAGAMIVAAEIVAVERTHSLPGTLPETGPTDVAA